MSRVNLNLDVCGMGYAILCPSSRAASPFLAFLLVFFALAMAAFGAQASPFAASVVSYAPGPGQWVGNPLYNDPARALGRPYGLTDSVADNTSVVTLGDGGSLTLAFDHEVTDDPSNPGGYDFIVFSNAIFVGGDPSLRWQEPAFVEISQDGSTWYLILPNILPSALVGGVDTGQSETILRNYAEYTPTLNLPQNRFPALPQSRTAEEFYTVPDRQSFSGDGASLAIDPTSGGGDAFDIADAVRETSPGVPELDAQGNPIPAGISWFRYVRITDALVGDKAGELGEISAEIDAVADVAPAVSVGAARRLQAGGYAVIWGARVTAAFPGEFWIEQPDRSAGLRIVSGEPVSEGDMVVVTGHVTQAGGDRAIADALVTVLERGSAPAPVGISNRSAGTEMALGLLVRVWGKRKAAGDGWFTVDDGSGLPVTVRCDPFTAAPPEGQFAVATGVLSRDGEGSPVVRIRRPEDIMP